MEMCVILEATLRRFVLEPASSAPERARLRGITFAPKHDGRVRVRHRERAA
jgi:hypothetical protein